MWTMSRSPIMRHNQHHPPRGFVSLLAVLLVMTAVMVLGLTFSTSAVSELQHGYYETRSQVGRVQAEACIEESLYRLKLHNDFTGGVFTVASTTCQVVVTGTGGTRTILATSTADQFIGQLGATAAVSGRTVLITEWQNYAGF